MTQEAQTITPTDKKKFYKKWWFWVIAVFVIIIIASSGNSSKDSTANTAPTDAGTKTEATPKKEAVTTEEPSIPVEYKSALSKAGSYASTMHMSKQGVYNQLTSEYGEKFSAEAAQYAIDNVKADWNANALAKAKNYQDTMHMSPEAIRDQLVSEYGEKFTPEEADYAIQHLNN